MRTRRFQTNAAYSRNKSFSRGESKCRLALALAIGDPLILQQPKTASYWSGLQDSKSILVEVLEASLH